MSSNKKQKISIDEYYKSKIQEGRIDFDPEAWNALEAKLTDTAQKSDTLKIVAFWKKSWIPVLLFMLIAITASAVWMFKEYQDQHTLIPTQIENNDIEAENNPKTNETSSTSDPREINDSTSDKNNRRLKNTLENKSNSTLNEQDQDESNESNLKKKQENNKSRIVESISSPGRNTGNPTSTSNNQKSVASKIENKRNDIETNSLSDDSTLELEEVKNSSQSEEESNFGRNELNSQNIASTSDNRTADISNKDKPSTFNKTGNTLDKNEIASKQSTSTDTASQNVRATEVQDEVSGLKKTNSDVFNDNVEDEQLARTNTKAEQEKDRTVEFPFLPLSQFGLVGNEKTNLDGDYLTPTKVEILRNLTIPLYIKVGATNYMIMRYDDNLASLTASVGYDYRIKKNRAWGIELSYERQRNVRNTSSFIQDLFIEASSKRDAFDLVSTFRWIPMQKRLSISSFLGLGMENTTWDMKSTLFYPFSDVIAGENQNTIYMKPSAFISIGGELGLDILKNRLSFIINVKHQYRLQDVSVNGTIQGYRTNASEYGDAYESIEGRIQNAVNFTSLTLGLKFYIF